MPRSVDGDSSGSSDFFGSCSGDESGFAGFLFDEEPGPNPDEVKVPAPQPGEKQKVKKCPKMEDPAKELKVVTRQREQVRQRVINISRTVLSEERKTLAQLTWMKSKLASAYQEFNGLHGRAMGLITDDELAAQEAIYEAFENACDLVTTKVEELLIEAQREATPEPTVSKPQVIVQQQPLQVPIPTFDGSYASWPKFKAVFQDLMAKSMDSDAIKLYHLDHALVGKAKGFLNTKTLNEGNYEQAWSILSENFENERVIVESHLQALLSLKRMSCESHEELRSLVTEVTHNVESLRYLKQELTGISEHMLVFLIANALDKTTRKAWEATQKKGVLPQYAATIKFLTARAHILESCEVAFPPVTIPKPTEQAFKPAQQCHAASAKPPATETACDFCGGSHSNYQCSTLTSLSTSQRREKVRSAGVCFNCLRKGHLVSNCPSLKACRKCEARHNTLLHEDAPTKRDVPPNPAVVAEATTQQQAETKTHDPADSTVSASCSTLLSASSKTVLLLTAVVDVLDEHGQPHPCRVLLDSGSQVNFVTEEMVNRLGVKKQQANVRITGINELRSHARDKVFVKFRSRVSTYSRSLECLVTPKVTGIIPTRKIDVSGWRFPEQVMLADPAFHFPDKVDMMIGGELFFEILKPRHLRLSDDLPQLRETQLGWIVAGVLKEPYVVDVSVQHSNLASVEEVENAMQQGWQVEDLPDLWKLSQEEAACESPLPSTYRKGPQNLQPLRETVTKVKETNEPPHQKNLIVMPYAGPPEEREFHVPLDVYGTKRVVIVLGLLWDPGARKHQIAIHVKPSTTHIDTSQMLNTDVAKFYDPTEEEVAQQRPQLRVSLANLNQIQSPRCVIEPNAVAYELHGFVDASNAASAACVYLRSIFVDGTIKMSVLVSKFNLVHFSDMSIPRKECCGALLLARLVRRVITELQMDFRSVVLWYGNENDNRNQGLVLTGVSRGENVRYDRALTPPAQLKIDDAND